MRKEFLVEEVLDSRLSVLLLLSGCELLLEPCNRLILCLDGILFVVLDVIEVGDGVLHRLNWACDCSEDLLIVLHTQRPHEEYDWNRRSAGAWNLYHQHTVTSLLDVDRLAYAVTLRENLGNLSLVSVLLILLYGDSVGSEVFHRDEYAFSAVDDEVATRI